MIADVSANAHGGRRIAASDLRQHVAHFAIYLGNIVRRPGLTALRPGLGCTVCS
jgi:hypothetical protein